MPTGQTIDPPDDDYSELIDSLEVQCHECGAKAEFDHVSHDELVYVCMACETFEYVPLEPDPDTGHDSTERTTNEVH